MSTVNAAWTRDSKVGPPLPVEKGLLCCFPGSVISPRFLHHCVSGYALRGVSKGNSIKKPSHKYPACCQRRICREHHTLKKAKNANRSACRVGSISSCPIYEMASNPSISPRVYAPAVGRENILSEWLAISTTKRAQMSRRQGCED